MPFWLTLLIQLALKFGLPWLETHVPANIAALIAEILGMLKKAPDQTQAMADMHDHFRKFQGVGTPPGLV